MSADLDALVEDLAAETAAVEVLLAMTVLAIGAAGVMSMQRGAILGDMEARRLDVANSVSRAWIERLRRDSTVWTTPNGNMTSAADNCGNAASFCPQVVAGCPSYPGGWYVPNIPTAYPADGQSPMFDALGRDLITADASKAVYCVAIRVDPIVDNPYAAGTTNTHELLRATVVVYWSKQLIWGTPDSTFCPYSVDPVVQEVAHPGTYHFLYASTPLMKNLLQ